MDLNQLANLVADKFRAQAPEGDVHSAPVKAERRSVNRRSRSLVGLNCRFSDSNTHVKFTPEDVMARLAAPIPRPRAKLTRYHGMFAPARQAVKHEIDRRGCTTVAEP